PRPVRAACVWPEASLAAAREMLLDYVSYSALVPNIREVEVRRQEPERTLVWQVHTLPPFSARETPVWMVPTEREDGGLRVSWDIADEPLAVQDGRVGVRVNQGYWEVAPGPEGGVAVVHEVAYDPGVRLPEWIVAGFRTRGLSNVMDSAR